MRISNERKGGDIDIMMLAERKLEFEELSRLRVGFWKRFGEQKNDAVYESNTFPFFPLAPTPLRGSADVVLCAAC